MYPREEFFAKKTYFFAKELKNKFRKKIQNL